jgi:hypothetical protein
VAAQTGRAQPEHGQRRGGEVVDSLLMVETQRGMQQNHLRGSAFLPLHQNRRGDTGKGVLAGGELGTAENGDVDEGNQRENGEELLGSVL